MAKDTKFRPSEEAPYAPVASIQRFFEQARMAKKPEKIDLAFMKTIGFEASNAWVLFPVIRFLGLMNSQSAPTQHYEMVYLSGGDFQAALRSRVEDAYSELFKRVEVEKADRDKLEQYFRVNFSPKLAERQARAFVGLCVAAGIALAEGTAGGRRDGTPARGAVGGRRERSPRGGVGRSPNSEQPDVAREREPPHDLRRQYVAALIKRVENSGSEGETKSLMDRIEKLLGIDQGGEAAVG